MNFYKNINKYINPAKYKIHYSNGELSI